MIDHKAIMEMKKKIDTLHETMTLEDFKRVHAKFFGCLVSVESGFERRFPQEWVEYEKEFYGEETMFDSDELPLDKLIEIGTAKGYTFQEERVGNKIIVKAFRPDGTMFMKATKEVTEDAKESNS